MNGTSIIGNFHLKKVTTFPLQTLRPPSFSDTKIKPSSEVVLFYHTKPLSSRAFSKFFGNFNEFFYCFLAYITNILTTKQHAVSSCRLSVDNCHILNTDRLNRRCLFAHTIICSVFVKEAIYIFHPLDNLTESSIVTVKESAIITVADEELA